MKSRSCRAVRGALVRYLDGETDPAHRARIESHADQCPACRAELEQARRFKSLWSPPVSGVAPMTGDTDADARAAILEAARREFARPRARDARAGARPWDRLRLGDLVTAAALSCSILLAVRLIDETRRAQRIERLPASATAQSLAEMRGEAAFDRLPASEPLPIAHPW